MLRAPPSSVGVIARPLVTQHGYASYVAHLPAFLKAYCNRQDTPFASTGFPVSLSLARCIPLRTPPVVIDFKGAIPSTHIDTLNDIGFERIKMNRTENIVRFPTLTYDQARQVRNMNPNMTTPAPVNTVNLQSFEMWILAIRVLSNLLLAHTYPAFTDSEHRTSELDEISEILGKRSAETALQSASKRMREEAGVSVNPEEIEVDMDEEEGLAQEPTIELKRAKPPRNDQKGWGYPSELPNTSGLFFPFVPELCSYDKTTVPDLIQTYLVQSLGDKPETQVERMDRLRSAWGVIGQTDAGNEIAHMCKVIGLCLTSQSRAFPVIRDSVYQGCMLSGGRLFVGMHGVVYRPLPFDKLQEESGSYHLHSLILDKIMESVKGHTDGRIKRPTTMRELRTVLLAAGLTEEDRDEIRRQAVHLHFSEKFLAVNAQTIGQLIDDLETPEDDGNEDLPLHHSALFSRDGIFVALSAFGYQAPSFMIENCPKVLLSQKSAPNTLVVRQKPLDLAVVDWKRLLETKEMRNNPRNLSRANRDRSLVGNDKTVVWGRLNKLATDVGGVAIDRSGLGIGTIILEGDGVEDW